MVAFLFLEEIMNELMKKLNDFAEKHGVKFEANGEVGFGRPCVGFLKNDAYIDFTPYNMDTFDPVFPNDERLVEPDGVEDAYHKHDCMAVLVHDDDYEKALNQLSVWVDYLEGVGVKLVEYKNGHTGINALLHGTAGWAFRRVSDLEE